MAPPEAGRQVRAKKAEARPAVAGPAISGPTPQAERPRQRRHSPSRRGSQAKAIPAPHSGDVPAPSEPAEMEAVRGELKAATDQLLALRKEAAELQEAEIKRLRTSSVGFVFFEACAKGDKQEVEGMMASGQVYPDFKDLVFVPPRPVFGQAFAARFRN